MSMFQQYMSTCSAAVTPVCVASGVGGVLIPGNLLVKAVAGSVLVAIGHAECIRPMRAFGLGLVAGAAGRVVVSAAKGP